MALHTKSQFAALCGLLQKDLYIYIGRKKVIVEGESIDDSNELNRLFMEKQRAKRGVGDGAPEKKTKAAKVKKEPKPEPTAEEIKNKDTLTDLLKQKNGLELQQRQNLIEIQKIEIQKKRGELIPTSAVKTVITLHSESIKSAYVEASDNLILLISQRKGFDSHEISDVKRKFVEIVNRAVDTAIDSTNKMLGTVISEFSTKRGVGQHD